MVISPAGPETKNDFAGEGQQHITWNRIPKSLTLKMASVSFAETLENSQYSSLPNP
jgi:hypothetical protein